MAGHATTSYGTDSYGNPFPTQAAADAYKAANDARTKNLQEGSQASGMGDNWSFGAPTLSGRWKDTTLDNAKMVQAAKYGGVNSQAYKDLLSSAGGQGNVNALFNQYSEQGNYGGKPELANQIATMMQTDPTHGQGGQTGMNGQPGNKGQQPPGMNTVGPGAQQQGGGKMGKMQQPPGMRGGPGGYQKGSGGMDPRLSEVTLGNALRKNPDGSFSQVPFGQTNMTPEEQQRQYQQGVASGALQEMSPGNRMSQWGRPTGGMTSAGNKQTGGTPVQGTTAVDSTAPGTTNYTMAASNPDANAANQYGGVQQPSAATPATPGASPATPTASSATPTAQNQPQRAWHGWGMGAMQPWGGGNQQPQQQPWNGNPTTLGAANLTQTGGPTQLGIGYQQPTMPGKQGKAQQPPQMGAGSSSGGMGKGTAPQAPQYPMQGQYQPPTYLGAPPQARPPVVASPPLGGTAMMR